MICMATSGAAIQGRPEAGKVSTEGSTRLSRFYPRRTQAAIKFQALIDHPLGGEALAGASVSQFCIRAPHRTIGIEQADILCKAGRVIGTEIKSGITPNF